MAVEPSPVQEPSAAAGRLSLSNSSSTSPGLPTHCAAASTRLTSAYIFPLMFFKRISDVYMEEFDQALEESGVTTSSLPSRRTTASRSPDGQPVGRRARPRREHRHRAADSLPRDREGQPRDPVWIFGNASWTNRDKLPDRKLADLIEHFDQDALQRRRPTRMSSATPTSTLSSASPTSRTRRPANTTHPRPWSVCSSTSSTRRRAKASTTRVRHRRMLIEVIEHVKAGRREPEDPLGQVLYGQERVLATSAIARMNLLLHGIEDFKIVREDTLRNPAFYTGNHLARFDCVVANPPFSWKNWGETEWGSDRWGRNTLGGVPPKGYADWAWVEHMLTSARPGSGRVAVVLPQGALFRQGAETRIRTHILGADVVDAVIGFGPQPLLRHRASPPAC